MRNKLEKSEKLKDEIFIYFLVECVFFFNLQVQKTENTGEKTRKRFHVRKNEKKY